MVETKIDGKEALEMNKTHNHYLDKRKDIMNSTRFKVEDVFGDNISKDSISPEQITELDHFLAKLK